MSDTSGLDALGGSLAYWEWSCPPGTDLDDRDACRAANPSLAAGTEGRPWALNEEWIYEVERHLLTGEGEFARERFGIFPDKDDAPQWLVVSEADYLACDTGEVDTSKPWVTEPVAISVEMTQDRQTVSVVAAGTSPKGPGAQVLLREPNSPAVLDTITTLALSTDRPVAAVVIDPRSQAGSLIPDLEDRGVTVLECPTNDLVKATGTLLDAMRSGGVWFRRSPELDSAVAQGQTRKYGEAELIDRWGPGDPTPLIGVALARWGVTNAPEEDREPVLW